jgi:hypothetical protein
MYQDTMNQIHALANERLNLYRLAGQQKISPAQIQRIQAITGELSLLWDQYRRQYAGRNYRGESRPSLPRAA